MAIMELPRLMRDSTTKDGHAEIVMDYVLSWCLRYAESKYNSIRPILSHYCRYMLGKLIDKDITLETNILSVKVWKENKRIDLTVEVVIDNNGTLEKHAILIENKYYSKLRDNQLIKYKTAFLKHYGNTQDWQKHYKLLSCLDTPEEVMSVYGKDIEGTEFTAYSFYELLSPALWQIDIGEYVESESEIFNEFWLRW